jgi:formate dehydrogenase major subunit
MPFVLAETTDISRADVRGLGIGHNGRIKVRSHRGAVDLKTNVTDQTLPGIVWVAFHFCDACANWLTNPAYDPDTITAEYKTCAVTVENCNNAIEQKGDGYKPSPFFTL